jgi:hypothetical protein
MTARVYEKEAVDYFQSFGTRNARPRNLLPTDSKNQNRRFEGLN